MTVPTLKFFDSRVKIPIMSLKIQRDQQRRCPAFRFAASGVQHAALGEASKTDHATQAHEMQKDNGKFVCV